MLTGFTAELAPWLASHRDVNAIDLTGVAARDRAELQRAAADNVKRVFIPRDEDWAAEPGLERLTAFVETKTVWHPIGSSCLGAGRLRLSPRAAICSACGGCA